VTPLFIAAKLYEHYGDLTTAKTFYPFMRHFLRYAEQTALDGVCAAGKPA